MDAFIRQYQYNSDMAPDRMQLQRVCSEVTRPNSSGSAPYGKREMIMMILIYGLIEFAYNRGGS